MNTNNTYTYQQIARAIEHLTTHFREQPSLSELAEKANLSEFHFQRLFTEWAGVSPKKFSQYLTLEHAKTRLRSGAPLADAAHEAGLSGTGRLHDLFVSIEGVTPGQFQAGGFWDSADLWRVRAVRSVTMCWGPLTVKLRCCIF